MKANSNFIKILKKKTHSKTFLTSKYVEEHEGFWKNIMNWDMQKPATCGDVFYADICAK